MIWFKVVFSSQRELHSVPIMDFLCSIVKYFVQVHIIMDRITKINSNHSTQNKVTSLETQITNKHSEPLERIDAADKNAKGAFQLAKNNEIIISELRHENQALKEKIQSDITEGAETVVKKYTQGKILIPKTETQIKGVLIELEDLRN